MRIAVFLAAGLTVMTALLHAQSDDDDDEMDNYPLVPSGNHIRFGLRYIGGPKVSFGELGNIPRNVLVGDTATVMARTYNDGYVNIDTRTDATGRPIDDGLTNTWKYNFSSQVTSGGDISFHAYSASTLGAGLKAESGSAAGWELQMGHSIVRIARKIDVSLVAGFSFSSMNAKTAGSVPATLNILTDVYSLYGQSPPAPPYTAPSYTSVPIYDSNGNPLTDSDGSTVTTSRDTTTLLGNRPISRGNSTDTTDVNGRWQIKGSYYTIRFGPMFQVPVTERLKLSLGLGAALAYVGSDYLVEETITLPDTETVVETQEQSTRSKLLPCFYADADAEYWLTERTGFYLGATYQKSGSFEQSLNGRTATVDLGSTYGIQSGLSLRF
ncbi:MAG: hypothetical protein PHE83_09115 [Opitutaceae bacterium]|nr:hypothetical protein [Opitutaceae bacterium]